ncbi:MFS transporter [Escherichia coli]
MQFACAPVLGALSDRFGRRPVLLVSLAGAAVDYAIMATAPFLWVLYIGRIVAGITGATGAVAGAILPISLDGDERARHFGFMSACFRVRDGRGTCAQWADGRFLPHAPFFARGSLNGLNFLTGCFLLPESHKGERRPLRREALNPLRFVPVGPGHDRRRRPDGGLLHHATCRTGAGRALGHFRRGSLSLGRDHDRHFACRIWRFCIHSPRQ